jgi:hypothetical protein
MPATYEPISTTTLASGTASVTFSGIPATYTDLVLVIDGSAASTAFDAWVRFNGDTATNYSFTTLTGSGSAANSNRTANTTAIPTETQATFRSTSRTMQIMHIFNYANATTFKSVLCRGNSSTDYVEVLVGLWRKTPEAITTILVSNSGGNNFAIGSTFTLYGVRAA